MGACGTPLLLGFTERGGAPSTRVTGGHPFLPFVALPVIRCREPSFDDSHGPLEAGVNLTSPNSGNNKIPAVRSLARHEK